MTIYPGWNTENEGLSDRLYDQVRAEGERAIIILLQKLYRKSVQAQLPVSPHPFPAVLTEAFAGSGSRADVVQLKERWSAAWVARI